MNKEEAIRERINPKIWDPIYLLTHTNRKVFSFLLNVLDRGKKLKILDIGCGFKPHERVFFNERFSFEYIGVDFTENSLADLILDMNKDILPFSDYTFDVIILSEVLEHLYNPFNAIKEAVRVLKKNGLIYISTPFLFYYHGAPYDYYRYTEFFYRKIAEEYNLEVLRIEKAGTFFSAPLYVINLSLNAMFEKLKIKRLVYPLVLIINFFSLIIDKIAYTLSELLKIESQVQYLNIGIAVILKKI